MLEPVNAAVQAVLDEIVAEGHEIGVQAAAYLDGAPIVSVWAGVADRATGRPVDGDTLFSVFSTTKGITAACIHMLAQWGWLEYDAPVADYWPEFGVHGKNRVTVRHVLLHQAGLPDAPRGLTTRDWGDWDTVVQAVAAAPLAWEPGTRTEYHAQTFGWILGEVVRRVDGRPIEAFIQQEIAAPLGIRDLYLGIPDAALGRVATLVDALAPNATPIYNRPAVRRAVLPGSGGIMSASALARVYAALVAPVDGVRLLTPKTLAAATALEAAGYEPAWDIGVRRSLGYLLGGPLPPRRADAGPAYYIVYGVLTAMGERETTFGHGGADGSVGFADRETGLAVGVAKNLMASALDRSARPAAYRIVETIRKELGIP
ncbi:MAG: serine hydrolase domain-containing protein [Anaerolineae bacterium]